VRKERTRWREKDEKRGFKSAGALGGEADALRMLLKV
jgi:hypothetical protein